MGSIDRLALGSVILGCVAFALGCLYLVTAFLAMFYVAELGGDSIALLHFTTWIGASFGAMALGLASLSRRSVRNGERRGRTQAWIGIALGVLQVPIPFLVLAYAMFYQSP